MINGVMPNLGNVLKYALPIAETVLPAVINKVINSNTSNDGPSYIPPQVNTTCNDIANVEETNLRVATDGINGNIKCSDAKVQVNLNMNVFVIHDKEDFEKFKDMSFSKTYEF